MNFDKKIEKAYFNSRVEKKISFLNRRYLQTIRSIINSYPEKYRNLLGLRASFIKWDLISKNKLNRYYYESDICGACVATEEDGYCFNCERCTLIFTAGWCCCDLRRGTTKKAKEIIFDSYMKEHKKWES